MKPKSPESLQHEDWFNEKLTSGSGTLVETKLGQGVTKNEDNPINGKVPVYLNDGRKVLCSIQNIKIIGFYD
jgi:hypothetical protein